MGQLPVTTNQPLNAMGGLRMFKLRLILVFVSAVNLCGETQMTGLRSSLGLIFLMTAALVFGETDSFSPVRAGGDEGSFPCSFGSLPSDIQNRLKGELATWKVQEPENLSEYTRKAWAGKKAPGCPGIAVGLFQNAKAPSYAVLFVPVGHPVHNKAGFSETEDGFRLAVFTRKVGLSSYEATVVERSNDHRPSNYFIRKVPTSRFFNEASKRKFQAQAAEGILMVDSAEQEYEADIYFWSNGRFRREPVDSTNRPFEFQFNR